MNFDRLTALLLDQAIRGELVPQLDGESAVEQIGEALTDVPFAIPGKWKWVHLQDVVEINPKVKVNNDSDMVSFVPMAAVSAGYVSQVVLDEEKTWGSVKNGYTKFSNGDILLAKITPCFQNRKSAIAYDLKNDVGCGSSEFHVLRALEQTDSEYLLAFFKTQWFIDYGVENFKGTAGQQRLGTKDLKVCLLPLPPLEEQRRIVRKLNELLGEVSRARMAHEELCKCGESFRKRVLQEAMRGTLVPQLDAEPAVEQLGDAPVGVPFEIPEKWKWVRLHDVSEINPRVKPNDENAVVSFIPMASVSAGYDGKITVGDERVWSSVKNGYTKFSNGDVILAKITPCFQNRKSAVASDLKNGIGCGSSEFHVIRASAGVDPEYVLMFLKSEWFIRYGMDNFKGTAGQQRLGTKELKACPFPLPPLPEQRRIIAKSKKLFGEVNRLLGQ